MSATNDYGLFQINAIHAWRVGGDLKSLLDLETNVRIAYQIWAEQGWVPWRWSRACHGL